MTTHLAESVPVILICTIFILGCKAQQEVASYLVLNSILTRPNKPLAINPVAKNYIGLIIRKLIITIAQYFTKFYKWVTVMAAYSNYTDYELIALMKEGSQGAYTVIYDRYKALMFRHAYKKLGNHEEAQDVIQDVFLTLWNRRAQVDEDNNLSGYLYTAIRNKILNIFAQKQVRSRYEESLLHFAESGNVVSDHLIRERQLAELIDKEISAMPEKMQEIFLLSRKAHMKNKEIAESLNISEHTVATQLKRALKLLRVRLDLLLYLFFLISH